MNNLCKLLISCDDTIYYHNGQYYYMNQGWYDFYQRYLRVFDSIKIVNRVCEEENLPQERVLISDSRVEVVHIPNFSGPKEYAKVYFCIGRKLHNVTDGCNSAIVRLPSTIGQRVCKHVMRSGIPYAVEVVYDAEDGWRSKSNIVERMLWKKIDADMRKTCYGADGVSCVTEFYLQKHYYSKKPSAFYSNYSSLSLEKSFYTSERLFPNRPLTVANVANQIAFNGRKGFKEIIEALSLLKKSGLVVNAAFAGMSYHNGEQQLKEYADSLGVGDNVKFMGYLSRVELGAMLDNVDLFVMPTKAEGLPRVIIEAMAKGLPAISTPVSGNPELLPSHFLVEYDDVVTLADRIKELATDHIVYETASKDNFRNSLKYEASILEKRRDKFYSMLKALAQQK